MKTNNLRTAPHGKRIFGTLKYRRTMSVCGSIDVPVRRRNRFGTATPIGPVLRTKATRKLLPFRISDISVPDVGDTSRIYSGRSPARNDGCCGVTSRPGCRSVRHSLLALAEEKDIAGEVPPERMLGPATGQHPDKPFSRPNRR